MWGSLDAGLSPKVHSDWVRRIGRIVLVLGIAVIVGLVTFVCTAYIMLRIDQSTLIQSCGFSPPAHSCSPPPDPWYLLPIATSLLGMATVGILLIRRRRGQPTETWLGIEPSTGT